jgi:tetratricopeptide (TPR) repeat protein
MVRRIAFFVILPLIIPLVGCVGTLTSQKDEDVLGAVKRTLPVHRDEDIIPAATSIATGSKKGSNTITISERGRGSDTVRLQRAATKALERGNWSEAIRAADAVITVEPTFDDVYVTRGLALLQGGQADRAVADCGQALSINPRNFLAFGCRGMAYQRKEGSSDLGNADLAEAARLAAVARGPVVSGDRDDEIAKFGAACMCGLSLACDQYKELVGRYPSSIRKWIKTRLDESRRASAVRDWDGVVRNTSEVLKIDRKNLVALCDRADACAHKGMLKEAAADSAAAISIDPDYIRAYNSRGLVRELGGQKKEALFDYQIACSKGLKSACLNLARLRTDKKPE